MTTTVSEMEESFQSKDSAVTQDSENGVNQLNSGSDVDSPHDEGGSEGEHEEEEEKEPGESEGEHQADDGEEPGPVKTKSKDDRDKESQSESIDDDDDSGDELINDKNKPQNQNHQESQNHIETGASEVSEEPEEDENKNDDDDDDDEKVDAKTDKTDLPEKKSKNKDPSDDNEDPVEEPSGGSDDQIKAQEGDKKKSEASKSTKKKAKVVETKFVRRSTRRQTQKKVCPDCSTIFKEGWTKCEVCSAIDDACSSYSEDGSGSEVEEVDNGKPEVVFTMNKKMLVDAGSKKVGQSSDNSSDSEDLDVICLPSPSEQAKHNSAHFSKSGGHPAESGKSDYSKISASYMGTSSSPNQTTIRKVDSKSMNDKFPSVLFCDACNTGYAHPIDFQCHFKILECAGVKSAKGNTESSETDERKRQDGNGKEEKRNAGGDKSQDKDDTCDQTFRELTPHHPSYSTFCRLVPYDPRADAKNWSKKKINRVQRCFKCNMFFPSLDDFMIHLNGSQSKLTEWYGSKDCLKCRWCNHVAQSLCRMQQHRFLAHRMNCCSICEKVFDSKDEFAKHMSEKHPQEVRDGDVNKSSGVRVGDIGSLPDNEKDLDGKTRQVTGFNNSNDATLPSKTKPSSQGGFVEVIGGSGSTKLLKRKSRKAQLRVSQMTRLGKRGLFICKMCDAICSTDIALAHHKKEFHPVVYKLEQLDVKYGPSWRVSSAESGKKKKKKKKRKHGDEEKGAKSLTNAAPVGSKVEGPVPIGSIGNQVVKIGDTAQQQGVTSPNESTAPSPEKQDSKICAEGEMGDRLPVINQDGKTVISHTCGKNKPNDAQSDVNRDVRPSLPKDVGSNGTGSVQESAVNSKCKLNWASLSADKDTPCTSTGGVTQSGSAVQPQPGVSLKKIAKIQNSKNYYKNPVRGRPRNEPLLDDEDISSSDETDESDCSWLDQSSDEDEEVEDILEPGEIRVSDAEVESDEAPSQVVQQPPPASTNFVPPNPTASKNTTQSTPTKVAAPTSQQDSMPGMPGNVLQLSNLLRTFHMVDVSELYQVAAQLIDPKEPGEAPKDEAMKYNREDKFLYKIPLGHSHPEFEEQALFPSSQEMWYRSHKYKYNPMKVLSETELEKKYKRTVPKYISNIFSQCLDDALLTHTDKVLRGLSLNVRRKKCEDRKELTSRLVKYIVSRYYANHPQEGGMLKNDGGAPIKIQGVAASLVIAPRGAPTATPADQHGKIYAKPNPMKTTTTTTPSAGKPAGVVKSVQNEASDSPISRFATMSSIRVRRFEMNHLSLSDTIGRIQHIQKFMANGTLPAKVKEKIAPLCTEICDPTVPLSQKVRNVRTMEILFTQDCMEQWNSYRVAANLPKMGKDGKNEGEDDSCEEILDDDEEEVKEEDGGKKTSGKDETIGKDKKLEKSDSCEIMEVDDDDKKAKAASESGIEKSSKDETQGEGEKSEDKESTNDDSSVEEVMEVEDDNQDSETDRNKADGNEVDDKKGKELAEDHSKADEDESTKKEKTGKGDVEDGGNESSPETVKGCEKGTLEDEAEKSSPEIEKDTEKGELEDQVEKSSPEIEKDTEKGALEGQVEKSSPEIEKDTGKGKAEDQVEKSSPDIEKDTGKEKAEDQVDKSSPEIEKDTEKGEVEDQVEKSSPEIECIDEKGEKEQLSMVQSQADVSHEEIDTDKSSEGSKSEQNQEETPKQKEEADKEDQKVDEQDEEKLKKDEKDVAEWKDDVKDEMVENQADETPGVQLVDEDEVEKMSDGENMVGMERKTGGGKSEYDSNKDAKASTEHLEADDFESDLFRKVSAVEKVSVSKEDAIEKMDDIHSDKGNNKSGATKVEQGKDDTANLGENNSSKTDESSAEVIKTKTSGGDSDEKFKDAEDEKSQDVEESKSTEQADEEKAHDTDDNRKLPDQSEGECKAALSSNAKETGDNMDVKGNNKGEEILSSSLEEKDGGKNKSENEVKLKSDEENLVQEDIKMSGDGDDEEIDNKVSENAIDEEKSKDSGNSENKDEAAPKLKKVTKEGKSNDSSNSENEDEAAPKLKKATNESSPELEKGSEKEPGTTDETVPDLKRDTDKTALDLEKNPDEVAPDLKEDMGAQPEDTSDVDKVPPEEHSKIGGKEDSPASEIIPKTKKSENELQKDEKTVPSLLKERLQNGRPVQETAAPGKEGDVGPSPEQVQKESEPPKKEVIPPWTIPSDNMTSSDSESSLSSDTSFQNMLLENINKQKKIKEAQQAQRIAREMAQKKKKEMEEQKIREDLSMKSWYEQSVIKEAVTKMKTNQVAAAQDETQDAPENVKSEEQDGTAKDEQEKKDGGKSEEDASSEEDSPKYKLDARERRRLEMKRKRALNKKRKEEELIRLAELQRKKEAQLKQRAIVVERLKKGYRASPRLVAQNISDVKDEEDIALEEEEEEKVERKWGRSGRTRSGRQIPNYAEDDDANKGGKLQVTFFIF